MGGLRLDADARQHPAPVVGLAVALRQRDRGRAAAGARDPEHHAQFIALTGRHVGDHLDHAPAGIGQAGGNAGQLVFAGLERGGGVALDAAVIHRARGRESDRARQHRVAREFPHLRDIGQGGVFQPRGPFAHHIDPPGAVGQLGGDIDVARDGGQEVQIVGERFPLPGQAFVQRGAGDVFDAFHQLDQAVMVVGAHRGETDAAVAHHRGGHAVQARGLHAAGPGGLAVVMGVDVDEAGGHQAAAGVDLLGAAAGQVANLGDSAVADADVGLAQFAAQAIGQRAAANDQIECLVHGVGVPDGEGEPAFSL